MGKTYKKRGGSKQKTIGGAPLPGQSDDGGDVKALLGQKVMSNCIQDGTCQEEANNRALAQVAANNAAKAGGRGRKRLRGGKGQNTQFCGEKYKVVTTEGENGSEQLNNDNITALTGSLAASECGAAGDLDVLKTQPSGGGKRKRRSRRRKTLKKKKSKRRKRRTYKRRKSNK